MATLKLSNVTKRFGRNIVAVNHMDLEVHDEEFLVLLGPSGCGKTTTLRMVAGLEEVTEGTITIDGVDIRDVTLESLRSQIGIVSQKTLLFHDTIEYMVVNPTWTIPDNLIKRDLIHVLRDNPMYLEENNIHVFSGKKEIQVTQDMLDPYEKSKKRVPYRFVQFPGDNNALGRIKFMFPNKYAVYLHDTDNKTLLTRRYKLYSSGCMRVDKPFELMDILLENAKKSYSRSDIEKIIETNKPKTIRLRKPVPVHMLYFTVYEEDGLAYFKNDVYLYDMIIEESVAGNKKATFTIPKNRMISVKKNAQPLSN